MALLSDLDIYDIIEFDEDTFLSNGFDVIHDISTGDRSMHLTMVRDTNGNAAIKVEALYKGKKHKPLGDFAEEVAITIDEELEFQLDDNDDTMKKQIAAFASGQNIDGMSFVQVGGKRRIGYKVGVLTNFGPAYSWTLNQEDLADEVREEVDHLVSHGRINVSAKPFLNGNQK